MKYTTIIFDCDGTLLNTLDDLRNAVNHVLDAHNYPTRSKQEIKDALGYGVAHLVNHSVPNGVNDAKKAQILDEFKAYYTDHLEDDTAPYEGILQVLDTLIAEGYKLAIVSNKIQDAITPLAKKYFGNRLPVAIGERPNLQRKPAPDMVIEAMKELASTPEESIYIGDSEVDVETARNSGLTCIGVTWGFRPESLHRELGVKHIARTPQDIIGIIHALNA